MKILKWSLISLGAVIILMALFVIFALIIPGMPTKGEKIGRYADPGKALLVIDIQESLTGKYARPGYEYPDSDKLIGRVNTVIQKAVKKGIQVIYIRQEFDGFFGTVVSRLFLGGAVLKGTPGTALDSRVLKVSDFDFIKGQSDAFSSKELNDFLIKNRISEVYLTGIDGAYCVNATAGGAVQRGYKTTVIRDAVASMERDKWRKVLEGYKEKGIEIITAADFPVN